MSELKPLVLSPEVTARLRDVVHALESPLLDLERAADAFYGYALAFDAKAIPDDLTGAGIVHFGRDLTARIAAVMKAHDKLFSLAVRGVLPERDKEGADHG